MREIPIECDSRTVEVARSRSLTGRGNVPAARKGGPGLEMDEVCPWGVDAARMRRGVRRREARRTAGRVRQDDKRLYSIILQDIYMGTNATGATECERRDEGMAGRRGKGQGRTSKAPSWGTGRTTAIGGAARF